MHTKRSEEAYEALLLFMGNYLARRARRARRLGTVRDVLLVRLASGDLVLVHITIGLRRQFQGQLVVGVLVVRFDVDVMQRDDARQRRDAARVLANLV